MVQLRAAGFSYLLPYRRPGPRDAFHYGRTGSPAEVVLGEGGVEDAVADVARPFGTEARLLFDPCRLRAEPREVQDACRDPGAHVVDPAVGSRRRGEQRLGHVADEDEVARLLPVAEDLHLAAVARRSRKVATTPVPGGDVPLACELRRCIGRERSSAAYRRCLGATRASAISCAAL